MCGCSLCVHCVSIVCLLCSQYVVTCIDRQCLILYIITTLYPNTHTLINVEGNDICGLCVCTLGLIQGIGGEKSGFFPTSLQSTLNILYNIYTMQCVGFIKKTTLYCVYLYLIFYCFIYILRHHCSTYIH